LPRKKFVELRHLSDLVSDLALDRRSLERHKPHPHRKAKLEKYRMTSANPGPRELLKTLMEENPAATEQELFELLVDAVKDEPEVKDAIIREYVWHVAAH
jgi:hypothetical protein